MRAAFVIAALCAAVCAAENATTTPPPARMLLARKQVPTSAIVVEGKQLPLVYELYNIGDVPATGITVKDDIDPSVFTVVQGDPNARIPELAPNASHSYNLTVVPRVYGFVDVPRAVVDYTMAGQAKRMVSSSPGPLNVTSAGAYLRATSYYLQEWSVFFLFTLPTVAVPALYFHAFQK
mmetsp:Transcript_25515/g.78511  ORF Transcript_25515/g.78511 Transcript_25515/m.78511 type:complete len:179 (-) Transcript_25515:134-670(-)